MGGTTVNPLPGGRSIRLHRSLHSCLRSSPGWQLRSLALLRASAGRAPAAPPRKALLLACTAALNLLGLATAVPLNPPPSPPSLPPALPPPPPPLTPGYVSVVSENELRSLIEGAAADISISLPPSAHFELSSQISCASSIKVTVASSGEGATLDGQGGTGLFHLEGGCSLTLRRLNLVNGRAVGGGVVSKGDGSTSANGGVVHANGAGDVEIIGSTVTGCSAASVRRVELATALQRQPPPCSAAREWVER